MKFSSFSKIFLAIFSLVFFLPVVSHASSLSVSPPSGTFSVGSTFDISVTLDTKGKSINAFQGYLTFPPDKLQIVSPSAGKSIVGVWTVPPKFNNLTGTVELEGGIPGGITTSQGVLTTITFRVKSVGEGIVKISDKSRVFLDDGHATDDLTDTRGGAYQFKLPPPEGPIVTSSTHVDQSLWYSNDSAVLYFRAETNGVESYSYVLNKEPVSVPDNIGEGSNTSVTYNNLSDGIHYFHIRSLRGGVWGGTTHFAIRVDTTPPATFPVSILPSARTTTDKPVVQFNTTDASSGLNHYELKLEPVSKGAVDSYEEDVSFFIETTSPFVTSSLSLGSYDVIVRAYDQAGNYQEVSKRFTITTAFFEFIADQGIQIKNWFLIPWIWVWVLLGIFILILLFIAERVWEWRREGHSKNLEKHLPEEIKNKLEELKHYRERYGSKAAVFLLMLLPLVSLMFASPVEAEVKLAPPVITTFSENISNKDIFYVGGRTEIAGETVILYLQNLTSGETISENIISGKDGEWFYRHNGFLDRAEYVMWTQGMMNEQLSPPSPQVRMGVRQTAIQFGGNRLSYEVIYLFVIILLGVAIGSLIAFIVYHYHHGRRAHKMFERGVKETEESIKRGFAVLRRDIEAELEVVRRANLSGEISIEEKEKENKLLTDLELIQQHLGKEVWEIKKESW